MLDLSPLLRPERAVFLELLGSLDGEQWGLPTECPNYSVKGIAIHVLGDDLSLVPRQRDVALNGLILFATDHPGLDFRSLLDGFNDQWVTAASFLSSAVVIDLLGVTGDRTADFYEQVDKDSPCEPVGFFGSAGEPSPYWQAIAREYVERWVHHSQIRRAIGLESLADESFVRAGIEVMAAAAKLEWRTEDGHWWLGPVEVGDSQQAADILTHGRDAHEIASLVSGPSDAVGILATALGRDTLGSAPDRRRVPGQHTPQ